MNERHRERYLARLCRLIEHIDQHLDEPLTTAELAAVAAFSPFHCQRQFSALFGIGMQDYVQRLRMQRAGRSLAYREWVTVTDIAFDARYANVESFSRAFRRAAGVSPTAFRTTPEWSSWLAYLEPVHHIRNLSMNPNYEHADVRIVERPAVRVALLDHVGPPERIGESVRRFIGWRRSQRLSPAVSATFNVLYDDPADTSPAAFRYGLAAATDRDIAANDEGVVAATLAGGRYALLRHVGPESTLESAIRFLFAQWLPASGESLRDAPPLLQRVAFGPEVPDHAAITDILLPLH